MAFTKVTAAGIGTTGTITYTNVSVAGVITATGATFTGNVSVGGTLTYEDVTNVDSVGLITARSGIVINDGGIIVAGVTTVSAGTTSIPSISPSGDGNTGIFFPSPDTIAFGEGGAEAARFDSSGRLLVGTTSDTNAKLVVTDGIQSTGAANDANSSRATLDYSSGVGRLMGHGSSGGQLAFFTNASGGGVSERARIDSSGRLLVGTSSARSWAGVTGRFQLEGTSYSDSSPFFINNQNSVHPAFMMLGKTRGTSVGSNTIVQNGDWLGSINFAGADGSALLTGANIDAFVDGTPGTNDMPGRLVFSTTADGAASPTERMRIDSSGRLGLGTNSPNSLLHIGGNNGIRFGAGGTPEAEINYTAVGDEFLDLKCRGTNSTVGNIRFFTGNTASAAVEAMRINNFGRVGIGNTAPSSVLHVATTGAGIQEVQWLRNGQAVGADVGSALVFTGTTNDNGLARISGAFAGAATTDGGYMAFSTRAVTSGALTERMRIDRSGRLLVGTTTGSSSATLQLQGNSSSSTSQPSIFLRRGSSPGSSDALGYLIFGDNSENQGAYIGVNRDGGTWTSGSSHPSRLVFSTTADGASSPTERMRIKENGRIFVQSGGGETNGGSNPVRMVVTGTSDSEHITSAVALTTTYSSQVMLSACYRTANSIYNFFSAYSGNGATDAFNDREFALRGDGNGFADGTWSGGGADYAEYFEWSDFNPDKEDRRGISVVLDGEKIREAVAGEDPIGVISGNPSVVGDAAWNKWSGKYLRDEFGTYLLDENGERQLNPAFDPDAEYIPREQRPEWDCVGLMGKLRIRKGQITGSRWIKMRDISDSVEEWLVR